MTQHSVFDWPELAVAAGSDVHVHLVAGHHPVPAASAGRRHLHRHGGRGLRHLHQVLRLLLLAVHLRVRIHLLRPVAKPGT